MILKHDISASHMRGVGSVFVIGCGVMSFRRGASLFFRGH